MRLSPVEIKDLLQPVLELSNPAIRAARRPSQPVRLQSIQRVPHLRLIQVHYRLAIRLLVASVHQRIQRQRIILRRRNIFLHQRAQHPRLHRTQYDVHNLPDLRWP
jgi:hypothetical protein